MASRHSLQRLWRVLIKTGVIKKINASGVSKEEYTYPENIKVELVSDVLSLNKAMAEAMEVATASTKENPCVIGLDTEWDRMQEVVLLQLSVAKSCILIRTKMVQESGNGESATIVFSEIKKLFESPNVVFVGSGIYECDLKKLFYQFDISIDNMCWIDTQDAARCMVSRGVFKECKRPGLAGLTKKLFGVPLNKEMQCTKWDDDTLSDEQTKYAVCDAVVSREILEQMFMKAVLCNKTDLAFGAWLWDLKDCARSIHEKYHHHHKKHGKSQHTEHIEETQHPRRYSKAVKLFLTIDANSSGVLEKEELLKLAEWYWSRLHPSETEAPMETYENMVMDICEKYGVLLHLNDHIELYNEYAPKMYEANKAYHDVLSNDT